MIGFRNAGLGSFVGTCSKHQKNVKNKRVRRLSRQPIKSAADTFNNPRASPETYQRLYGLSPPGQRGSSVKCCSKGIDTK